MGNIPRLRLREKGGGPKGQLQPPGRDQRNARSIREWAYRSGMMPQVFLLKIVRGEVIDDYTPTFEDRFNAAKACVNYFAPSMRSVEVKDMDGVVTQTNSLVLDQNALERLSDEELVVLKTALTKLQTGTDTKQVNKVEAKQAYKSTLYH